MIDLETTVEIDRPVPEVFAFVADQTNAPQWQGGLHVSFEEDRFVEFEIPDGWLTGRASYGTAPSVNGTILTSRIQFRAHGPLALVEPVLSRVLNKDSRRDEANLKRLLEREAQSAGLDPEYGGSD